MFSANKVPTIAPDIKEPFGYAWKVPIEAKLRAAGIKPEDDATVASWCVFAPWAHPAWAFYNLHCVHLRPMPDGQPTIVYAPNATHEFWLHALNPDADIHRWLTDEKEVRPPWLHPKNFSAQIVCTSDAHARFRMQETVKEICRGELSPDTDFLREWIKRFGDNMIKLEYRETKGHA